MNRQLNSPPRGGKPYAEDTKQIAYDLDTPGKPRRPSYIFAVAIDCNLIRRQTQAGLLSVCDKFSPRIVSRTVHSTFDYTVMFETRRKRAGQLSARDIIPAARSLARSQRYVRCALPVNFGDSTPHASKAASVAPRKSRVNRCCPETDRTSGFGEVGARRISTPVLSLNVRANKTSRRSCVSPNARAAA